jgi:hypothetical protein
MRGDTVHRYRPFAPEVPRGIERSGPGLWGGVQALADRSQVPRARRVLRRFVLEIWVGLACAEACELAGVVSGPIVEDRFSLGGLGRGDRLSFVAGSGVLERRVQSLKIVR